MRSCRRDYRYIYIVPYSFFVSFHSFVHPQERSRAKEAGTDIPELPSTLDGFSTEDLLTIDYSTIGVMKSKLLAREKLQKKLEERKVKGKEGSHMENIVPHAIDGWNVSELLLLDFTVPMSQDKALARARLEGKLEARQHREARKSTRADEEEARKASPGAAVELPIEVDGFGIGTCLA